jgi:hypothetical protein
MENEVSRTRNFAQRKSIRVEGRFQGRIYIISNIIRKFVCQTINYLYFKGICITLWYYIVG